MPRALHSEWRCPTCGSVRRTSPAVAAFCTDDDCPESFTEMEPHQERTDLTAATLAYPHLTPDQRRIDRLMREVPSHAC